MDRPDVFEGVMAMYAPPFHRGEPTPGWRVAFSTPDGQLVPTVSGAVIHIEPERPAWAELTMFADADGRPILTLPRISFTPAGAGLVDEGDGYRKRTFAYQIEFIAEPAGVTVSAP